MPELDRIDRRILDILQREGRISMTELGERIGLSTSPCAERVRRMERNGVITGYHARVDPKALGRNLLVFVEITLSAKSADVFDEVRKALLHMPEVMECHLVSAALTTWSRPVCLRWRSTAICWVTSSNASPCRASRTAMW